MEGFAGVGLREVRIGVAGHHLVGEVHAKYCEFVVETILQAADSELEIGRAFCLKTLICKAIECDAIAGRRKRPVRPTVELRRRCEPERRAHAGQEFGVRGAGRGVVIGEHAAGLLVAFHANAGRHRQAIRNLEAVLQIEGNAVGGIDDVAVVDPGAILGTRGADTRVIGFFGQRAHAELGLADDAEQCVIDLQPRVDAVALEGPIVAGQGIGEHPTAGRIGGGGSHVIAPVVAGHVAPVDQRCERDAIVDIPLMVDVEGGAIGQVEIIGCGVVSGAGAVVVEQQAAVGNVGVVFMVGELEAQRLAIAQRKTRLGHDVDHLIALVHEAVTAGMRGHHAAEGIAGAGASACLEHHFARVERPGARREQHAIIGRLGLEIDHTTDGRGPVAQGGRALEHLDAIDALDARVEVAVVADEQPRRHGHAVFEDQRLGLRRAQATHADVRHHGRLLLTHGVHAGHAPQRILGGQRQQDLDVFAFQDDHGAGLAGDCLLAPADDLNGRNGRKANRTAGLSSQRQQGRGHRKTEGAPPGGRKHVHRRLLNIGRISREENLNANHSCSQ